MKIQVAKLMPYLLLLISAVLAGWGVLGLLEYFFPAIVLGLQNEKFPAGLQFLHFFSIFATGAIFIGGHLNRWRHTPFATVVMYAVLATLCFIETVDFEAFGGGTTRFIPMVIEYVAYLGFSAYLLRSSTMHHHFCSGSEVAEGRTKAERSGPNISRRPRSPSVSQPLSMNWRESSSPSSKSVLTRPHSSDTDPRRP